MATSAFFKFDFRRVIPTSGRVKIDFIPSSVISSYGAPTVATPACLFLDEFPGYTVNATIKLCLDLESWISWLPFHIKNVSVVCRTWAGGA